MMIDWLCACPAGENAHSWADDMCSRCLYVAPPRPVAPEPSFALSDTERARMLGLVEWADQAVASRPELAGGDPMIRLGIAALLKTAMANPDARYAQLATAGAAIDAIEAWVTAGVPPDPTFLDALLGPAPTL